MSRVTIGNLIGCSPAFQDAVELIRHIAETDAPVLIEGETGTGKEVAARAIHYSGARQARPFVAVNCGALPEQLIENELFGHARGAYTDARGSQTGLVALADGGTLFLDEVESLCARGQVALLRFLQDLRYRPLGGQREERADVRIIAATNVNLWEMVVGQAVPAGSLLPAADSVPPAAATARANRGSGPARESLRQRLQRTLRLARRRFARDSIAVLDRYGWPGNVRELENLVHRAMLLTSDPLVIVPRAMADAGHRQRPTRRTSRVITSTSA